MEGKKRVLYIGTPIFNYHKQIISEFEAQGYEVDYYNDRPSENSIVKGIIKVKRNLVSSLVKKYINQIIKETEHRNYELVFIVNCKVFTPTMLMQLKNSQKTSKFILYMWDSIALYPNVMELLPLFDKVYSFDSEDCLRNPRIEFLPLFYCIPYEQIGKEEASDRVYDIVSVCTAHPNRYKIMRELFPELREQGLRIYSYMYINKLQFLYNKAFVTEFRGAMKMEFNFIPLSEQENLKILSQSNTVFDIQHNRQSGLTMRTIETLGAKRKLITTNTNIRNYDFYNKNNIYILDEYNRSGIEEFMEQPYKAVEDSVYRKYSLKSWISYITRGNRFQEITNIGDYI
jgi:hypothetical protein